MRFPAEFAEISQADDASARRRLGSAVVERGTYSVRLVVLPKSVQLLHKSIGIPEEGLVKKFSGNSSDQLLDRLGARCRERLMTRSCCFT